MRSLRAQLTALYLAFFTLLFAVFSVFLYGQLARSLTTHVDERLASEADTAAVLFPDELHELHNEAHERCFIANSIRSEVRVEGSWRGA